MDSRDPGRAVNGVSAAVAARLVQYARAQHETNLEARRVNIEREMEVRPVIEAAYSEADAA